MIEQRAIDRVTPKHLVPVLNLPQPPAAVRMVPTLELPADDLGGGLSRCDALISSAPTEITPGDGGQVRCDARYEPAATPTHLTDNGSGQCGLDVQKADARSAPQISDENGLNAADTQRPSAVPVATQQGVESSSAVHQAADTHKSSADLDRLHALLGHFARQLWDVQKERIGAGNRVAAMERDGLSDYAEPARHVVREYEAIEKAIDRELTKLAKKHFMVDWIAAQRGIGYPGFARLLGVTGDISRFATVSKLWKYLGLHVVDGHAPKREKGVPWTHTNCQGGHLLTCKPACATDHHPSCIPGGIGTAYAPQGRVICHQIGEAIVKVGGDGPYRRAYDEKKAYYEAGRPEWTQARRHNAAMRYAVKELIKNLWIEWHTRRGHVGVDAQVDLAASFEERPL